MYSRVCARTLRGTWQMRMQYWLVWRVVWRWWATVAATIPRKFIGLPNISMSHLVKQKCKIDLNVFCTELNIIHLFQLVSHLKRKVLITWLSVQEMRKTCYMYKRNSPDEARAWSTYLWAIVSDLTFVNCQLQTYVARQNEVIMDWYAFATILHIKHGIFLLAIAEFEGRYTGKLLPHLVNFLT